MSQALVRRACAKLRSAIADGAVVRLHFTFHLRLREMLDALEVIQQFMENAEMQQQLSDGLALERLMCARQAAYRVMDMVDELQDTRLPAAATTKPRPRLAIKKVEHAKNEVIRLKESCDFYASEEEPAITQQRQRVLDERTTAPIFEEASVFGRGADKQRVVTVLLSVASNITQAPPICIILPIFGLAGSGKTTLAKMVFNDTDYFTGLYNFRVWVYASPELDFHRIGESILRQVVSGGGEKEEIDDEGSNSDVLGMEPTMKHLHELLNGKRVLFVLDDLWEEDSIQLQLLKSMLTFLGDKVDVIVTTCNQAIARKICTVEPYRLNPLDDDTCWEIIKKSICFEEKHEELEKIGLEIASKCWGLPSAARAYACMLDSRDPRKWEKVMRADVRDIFSGSYSLLSTLELSYRSIPPDLGLCFDYCCNIFPNGHNIVKEDLIHQWIAIDLIEPSEISSAIEISEGYITRLLDMSLFQTAKSDSASGNDDKGIVMLTMHDLAHDYASWITMKFIIQCFHYLLVTNYHGKLDDRYDGDLKALRCVGCSKVEFNDGMFSSKRSLRVLELKESSVPKLPDSIWQLRHLGYLKISEFSGLVTLPESFGDLNNLLHIDLSGCSGLINLPESFEKLIRLVHVNLSGCSGLVSLPESFGKIINLVHFNLSGCTGLVSLPESFGKLINLVHFNLSGCTRLVSIPESFGKLINLVHFNLSGCTGLATLPEAFGDLVNLSHVDLSRCHRLAEILEPLQKLDKLVYLDLSFWSCFEGIDSLGRLTNLQHLNLSNPCYDLAQHRTHLQGLKDGLCKLTSLRYLNLSMCLNPIFYYHKSQEKSLQYIQSCISSLSSLEHLDLSHNKFLVDLPQSLCDLNKLHTLDLSGCIRLKRLAKRIGEISSLKLIVLNNCRGLESCQFVVHDDKPCNNSSNLVQLEVVDCKELEISCLEMVKNIEEAQRIRLVEKQKIEILKLCWSIGAAQESVEVEANALLGELVPPHSLQCLELHGYSGEACLPAWRIPSISSHLPNLVEVTLEDFPRCTILPPLGLLPNLKRLLLRRMASITRIDDRDVSGSNREAFSRLSKVTIDEMEKLEFFLFPSVPELVIRRCPELSFGPHSPRAQRFMISDSNNVMSSWVRRQGQGDKGSSSSTPVTELVVENCNLPLGDSSLLHHLPGLRSLTLKKCNDLITSSTEIFQALSSLQSLCFSHCKGMISLPEYLCDTTSLREFTIQSCHGMKSLPQSISKLTNLKDLYIVDCPELKKWCESEENEVKLAHIRPKYEKVRARSTA